MSVSSKSKLTPLITKFPEPKTDCPLIVLMLVPETKLSCFELKASKTAFCDGAKSVTPLIIWSSIPIELAKFIP
jgi:hypothetical protein